MRILCVLAILTFICAYSLAQSPQTGGSISGKVIDSESGKPIFAAKVEVIKDGKPIVNFGYTDSNGNFSLSNIPDGGYELTVSKAQCLTEIVSGIEVKAGVTSSTKDISLQIAAPIQVGEPAYDFRLTTPTGEMVSVSSFKGKSILVLCINNVFG